ncbi:MAG: iron-sulfur cluster assembly scaffold protein [Deltaproteobacteria bacterium]|nr:iron-sulfur cluster assembly scaffold protein [Deltaproteobacteria bacterium]
MQDWKKHYQQHQGIDDPVGYLVYNETILDHFKNPRHIGEIEKPDGMALVGDPRCGDHIRLYLTIEGDKIVDIRYKVFGCAAAIATTSILTELVINKNLDEALAITDDDIIKAAGGIPARKAHCSLLGVMGLHKALAEYFLKKEKGEL